MATINWSFADLFKGDEAEKEATTNTVMKALNASPSQRDVRVHDGPILRKIMMTPEGEWVAHIVSSEVYWLKNGRCDPANVPSPQCITDGGQCSELYNGLAPPCPPPGYETCYSLPSSC